MHFSTEQIDDESGMDYLRMHFPDATANDLNFVIFSTSGVHGSYITLENIEECVNQSKLPDFDFEWHGDYFPLTFLVVMPRIVAYRYGNCLPTTPEDFEFLRNLRESSRKVMSSY